MISDLRAALAAAAQTITGLNVDGYMVDRIRSPHLMFDYDVDYDLVLSGAKDTYPFTAALFVQRSDVIQAQKYLDTLRDPNAATSLKTALENGSNYSITLDYVRVRRSSRPQVVTVGDPQVEYLMAEFEVEVVL